MDPRGPAAWRGPVPAVKAVDASAERDDNRGGTHPGAKAGPNARSERLARGARVARLGRLRGYLRRRRPRKPTAGTPDRGGSGPAMAFGLATDCAARRGGSKATLVARFERRAES